MKGAREIDQIDQLITRINQNLSDYHDHIKGFEKDQIIEMAGRINAMSDAHMYLTQHHAFTYEDAEYLLQFSNPLEIVADKWEARISDLSDMSFDIEKICYDKDAEINGYELAGADTPAAEQTEMEASPGDAKPKTPSVLDRRLAEHEFSKAIHSLLPDSSPIALTCWINYALSLEYDGKQPATQSFTELTAALASVKRNYGEEIATQVFHVAFEMPIPVSDIPGAANHLKNGGELNDIIELSLDGKLEMPSTLGQTADVKAEAERIVAAIQELAEPNSPNKTHFMTPLSREFLLLASTNDHDRLFDALKYKTMNLTNITGEKGIFVTVAKDEILKQRESQKPSDRGRAPDADQLKSLAREEAQRLIKELRALKEPNDSFSGQYTAKISDEFIKQAGFAYDTLLFNAFAEPLHMAFGSMSGEKGSFLTVTNSVRKRLSVAKEKPSILGQLADAQKEAAAQNQPGKDKGIKKGREEL